MSALDPAVTSDTPLRVLINEERGRIERELNVLLKSGLVEEKQYIRYRLTRDAGQPIGPTGSLAAQDPERGIQLDSVVTAGP